MTGTNAAGAFAVLGIHGLDDVHTRGHPSERDKGLYVVRWRVVAEIDEDLRRPSIFDGKCKGDRAFHVGVAVERIVLERLRPPGGRDRGIAVDAELDPAA